MVTKVTFSSFLFLFFLMIMACGKKAEHAARSEVVDSVTISGGPDSAIITEPEKTPLENAKESQADTEKLNQVPIDTVLVLKTLQKLQKIREKARISYHTIQRTIYVLDKMTYTWFLDSAFNLRYARFDLDYIEQEYFFDGQDNLLAKVEDHFTPQIIVFKDSVGISYSFEYYYDQDNNQIQAFKPLSTGDFSETEVESLEDYQNIYQLAKAYTSPEGMNNDSIRNIVEQQRGAIHIDLKLFKWLGINSTCSSCFSHIPEKTLDAQEDSSR